MKDIRNIEREQEHTRMRDMSRGRFLSDEEIRILLSEPPRRMERVKTQTVH